jgi:hypothetical protein
MTKPMIRIIDGNQIVDREMTDEEFTAYEANQSENAAIAEAQAEAQAAKATARQALLEKLGITEEEAQLLLGGI